MTTRMRLLQCYKQMLRQGEKFTNYNFRNYALRRVKDGFRANQGEKDPLKVEALLQKAEQDLSVLKRQAIISQLYRQQPNVIERKSSDI